MTTIDEPTRNRLLGLFVAEAEECLAALLELAGRFRDREDPAAILEFKQTAHSLKGAAAAVGLPELVWCIHRIEVLGPSVGDLQGGARADAHDRLTKVLHVLESVAGGVLHGLEAVKPELDQLRVMLAGVEVSAPAAPPTPAPAEPSGQRPNPEGGPGDAPVERLNVPAHEVDEALRLASSGFTITGSRSDCPVCWYRLFACFSTSARAPLAILTIATSRSTFAFTSSVWTIFSTTSTSSPGPWMISPFPSGVGALLTICACRGVSSRATVCATSRP